MASKNPSYSLDIELLQQVVEEFRSTMNGKYCVQWDDSHEAGKKVTIISGKDKGVLNIYIKAGGLVSFQIQGKAALNGVCQKCRDFIIGKTQITLNNKKSFSIDGVVEDDLDILIEYLRELGCQVEEKTVSNDAVRMCYHISGKHREVLTLNYYTNQKLLIQGNITRLFVDFITLCTDVFSEEVMRQEQKKFFEVNDADLKVFDTNLRNYIPENYDKIEGKITTILLPSLLVMNKPLDLPDYSCYSFPALKAIEGVLKKRIGIETPLDQKESIGIHFLCDGENFKLKSCSLFTRPALAAAIEEAYRIYHKYRHTTFHFDESTETTRLVSYDEAKDIIDKCLKTIGRICKNW